MSIKIEKFKLETRILIIICSDYLVGVCVVRGIQGLEHLVLSTVKNFTKDLPKYKFLGEVRYALIYECPQVLVEKISDHVQVIKEENLGDFKYLVYKLREYLNKVLLVVKSFKPHINK
ncbi:MAG: hypothetical protein DRO15_02540 [Thermoprotei archaeon]|nr:MAG: hypothetical protein DRO15_02540 [Thermoprotei archaeon]